MMSFLFQLARELNWKLAVSVSKSVCCKFSSWYFVTVCLFCLHAPLSNSHVYPTLFIHPCLFLCRWATAYVPSWTWMRVLSFIWSRSHIRCLAALNTHYCRKWMCGGKWNVAIFVYVLNMRMYVCNNVLVFSLMLFRMFFILSFLF